MAIADPGWFFVIQEQPTEPRFGLDAADFATPRRCPDDMERPELAPPGGHRSGAEALSHAPTTTALPIIDNVEWGRNAAHQAYITLQRPVRIAIHARDMIPT